MCCHLMWSTHVSLEEGHPGMMSEGLGKGVYRKEWTGLLA